MSDYFVVTEDSSGCFFGDPEYFTFKDEAINYAKRPQKLHKGHVVVLYKYEFVDVILHESSVENEPQSSSSSDT